MFLTLKGKVKRGKQIGGKLGFPTINISVPREIKKDHWGIYFSFVKIGGKIYPGVTHLGPPKSFHLSRATCETHLLTLRTNLYNQEVEKKLLVKFREVQQFPSLKHLKKQLQKDVKQAKKFFGL